VVRATVIGGTKESMASMEELHKLMRANSIHVPSSLRLLRLATGKKCEFCLVPLGRDSKFIHSWSYGVFACWNCASGRSRASLHGRTSLSKRWSATTQRYGMNRDRYDAVLHHPRNAISKFSPDGYGRFMSSITRCYVWRERRTSAGEVIGPLISWDDIDQMVNNMKKATDPDVCNQMIDEYLEDILEVPDVQDYEEFNDAYQNAKVEYNERLVCRRGEYQREQEAYQRVKEEKKRGREAEQRAKEDRKSQREAAKQARGSAVAIATPSANRS